MFYVSIQEKQHTQLRKRFNKTHCGDLAALDHLISPGVLFVPKDQIKERQSLRTRNSEHEDIPTIHKHWLFN